MITMPSAAEEIAELERQRVKDGEVVVTAAARPSYHPRRPFSRASGYTPG
jgi:hypothetical protein